MTLNVHSDASYLSAPKARSRAGGYFFLGSIPRDAELIIINGTIYITCENIPTWISLSGDLAFCHQDGIYGFKFPKRFSELSLAKTSL